MNAQQLVNAISTLTAPLSRALSQILRRDRLLRSRNQGAVRLLQVQIPGGTALDNIEHLEPFGFTSQAPQGADVLTLAFAGDSSHSVAILVGDRRYRLQVAEGEMAIYNRHHDKVHIKDDRSIAVEADLKVQLITPLVECSTDLTVGRNLKVAGDSVLQKTLHVKKAATFDDAVSIGKDLSVTDTSTATDHISNGISGASHTHDPTTGLPE